MWGRWSNGGRTREGRRERVIGRKRGRERKRERERERVGQDRVEYPKIIHIVFKLCNTKNKEETYIL